MDSNALSATMETRGLFWANSMNALNATIKCRLMLERSSKAHKKPKKRGLLQFGEFQRKKTGQAQKACKMC